MLNKFNKIKTNVDEVLTDLDREYLIKQENIYKKSMDFLEKTENDMKRLIKEGKEAFEGMGKDDWWKEPCNKHIEYYLEVDKAIEWQKETFIYKVCDYLTKTYSIKIDSCVIGMKYTERCGNKNWEKNSNEILTYSVIVNDIYEQLGGLDFDRIILEQLLENNSLYKTQTFNDYSKTYNYYVKGSSITFSYLANCVEPLINHYQQELALKNENQKPILKSKIKFKNQKSKFTFENKELATKFACKYLGFTGENIGEEQKC